MGDVPKGRAARFALDPESLLAFLHSREEFKTIRVETKRPGTGPYTLPVQIRLINGCRVSETDARTMRRWTKSAGVTQKAAMKLLRSHRLTLKAFMLYCEDHDVQAIVWDRRRKENR